MKFPESYLTALCMHCALPSTAHVNNSEPGEKCNGLYHCEQRPEMQ